MRTWATRFWVLATLLIPLATHAFSDSSQRHTVTLPGFTLSPPRPQILDDSGSTALINLIEYFRTQIVDEPADHEHYNRAKHFGSWIQPDRNCQNTRAKVLLRDDISGNPQLDTRGCRVTSGVWEDEYTGDHLTSARTVQIDHFVPLKNAYEAGAWKWRRAKRCTYANFLALRQHLRSVSGTQNQSKGDRGPEEYMPPAQWARCAYLHDWMRVKAAWSLTVKQDEFDAIQKLLEQEQCSQATRQESFSDLENDRQLTEQTLPACDQADQSDGEIS